jgi:ubiquinone biosynthesis protein UbiJ
MGRPPIGKHAMSGAERQRRYLARLLSDAKPARKPDGELTRLQAEVAGLKQELAAAKARIAEVVAARRDDDIGHRFLRRAAKARRK